MDRFDAMRVFTAVATQASFVEAARKLRLSPSAVSRAVTQIEAEVGVILFNRTTRAVQLTAPGARYLEDCRRILAELEDAGRRLRGENAAPRGFLTVAAPLLFGRLHILPILTQILAAHPALSIRLALSDRNVHLAEEEIDIAIRIGELADSALIALRLGAVRRVLAASPAYLQRRGAPESPDALAGHDIIAFDGLDATNEWRFGADAKTIRIEPRLTVNSADAAIAAARAGAGITRALSYQVRDEVLAGRLALLLENFSPPASPVHALYPARRIAAANVTLVMARLRDYFGARALL